VARFKGGGFGEWQAKGASLESQALQPKGGTASSKTLSQIKAFDSLGNTALEIAKAAKTMWRKRRTFNLQKRVQEAARLWDTKLPADDVQANLSNPLEFLADVLDAEFDGEPPPSVGGTWPKGIAKAPGDVGLNAYFSLRTPHRREPFEGVVVVGAGCACGRSPRTARPRPWRRSWDASRRCSCCPSSRRRPTAWSAPRAPPSFWCSAPRARPSTVGPLKRCTPFRVCVGRAALHNKMAEELTQKKKEIQQLARDLGQEDVQSLLDEEHVPQKEVDLEFVRFIRKVVLGYYLEPPAHDAKMETPSENHALGNLRALNNEIGGRASNVLWFLSVAALP